MRYEIYPSGFQWRWRLRDNHYFNPRAGEIIATSHDAHSTKQKCRSEISKVKGSSSAQVVETPN